VGLHLKAAFKRSVRSVDLGIIF